MVCFDLITIKTITNMSCVEVSRFVSFLECIFFIWISEVAALFFITSIFLTILHVLSLMQLFYVYASISGFTLALACSLYAARRIFEWSDELQAGCGGTA